MLRSLNEAIADTLPKRAVEEAAKRLGVWSQGGFDVDSEEDLVVVLDAAVHDYAVAGTNAVARYAARRDATRPADATIVLDAMRDAYPALLEIVERVEGVGVRAYDVLADREELIVDPGLAKHAEEGTYFVTRLLSFEGMTTTTGAASGLVSSIAAIIAEAPPLPRFTQHAKYRSGIMTHLYRLALATPEAARVMLTNLALTDNRDPFSLTIANHLLRRVALDGQQRVREMSPVLRTRTREDR